MNQKAFSPKVALDMFIMQMVWSLWFLGFILAVHIVILIISYNTGDSMGDFLFFSHGSAKVYMLVIGIFSAYAFLTYYVQNGLTRKDYFKGSAVSAAGIALAMGLIATVLTGLEYIVLEMIDLPVTLDRSLAGNGIESSDNSISIFLPKAIIDSSILVHSSNWIASLFMYCLNIFAYYVIGWFIGAGFYRFGWLIGLGFITISFLIITIVDLLWGTELGEPLSNWLPFDAINLPLYGSFIGTIALIGIMLWVIRLATRDVTIKM